MSLFSVEVWQCHHVQQIMPKICIVCRLQDLARNKELWMTFVDFKKAFDMVPREVVWWALRYLGVEL